MQKTELLMVDLDNTLVRSDLFFESLIKFLSRNPLRIFEFIRHLLGGRASAKALLARGVAIDPSILPYNEQLLEYVRSEAARGRKVYLATASHQVYAEQVAAHLGIFSGVIATTDAANTKGKRKLVAIQEVAGNGTWTYAGDSRADIPIWRQADSAVLVDAPRGIERELNELDKVEKSFRRRDSMLASFFKAIRMHQWSKNMLVFVPLLTSHMYQNIESVFLSIAAFASFSLCASGMYLLNDLVDIDSDRRHETKKHRPIASGKLPVHAAVLGAIMLPLIALAISALLVNTVFLAAIIAYIAINLAYSLYIKRIRTVDVLTLAVLYTVRIVAGAAAIGVALSFWLLAFSIFLFVSLAYLKRYIEVASVDTASGKVSGRGYSAVDCETMFVLGSANATASILVLALFVNSDEVASQYQSPEILWSLCFIMLYWTNRIWVKARSGQINEDPVAFAIRDKISIGLGACCVVAVALARSLSLTVG